MRRDVRRDPEDGMCRVAAGSLDASAGAEAGRDRAQETGAEEGSELLPRADAARLLTSLRDPDPSRRAKALTCLTRLGRRAVPFLLRLLLSGERELRKFALELLGKIGAKEAAGAIVPLLEDRDPLIRAAAAEALGCLGADAFSGELSRMAEREEDPWVKAVLQEVVKALPRTHRGHGKWGAPETKERDEDRDRE